MIESGPACRILQVANLCDRRSLFPHLELAIPFIERADGLDILAQVLQDRFVPCVFHAMEVQK